MVNEYAQRTIDSLRQVLEAAGVEFTDGRKPGVRLSIRSNLKGFPMATPICSQCGEKLREIDYNARRTGRRSRARSTRRY